MLSTRFVAAQSSTKGDPNSKVKEQLSLAVVFARRRNPS